MNEFIVTWTLVNKYTRQRRTFSVTIPAEDAGRARHAAAGFAWEAVTAAEGVWKIANVPEPFTAVEAPAEYAEGEQPMGGQADEWPS